METQRGRCCECDGLHTLTRSGRIPAHYGFTAQGRSKLPCAGSGRPPSRVVTPKEERVPLPARIVISGKAQIFAALKDVDLESLKAFHKSYEDAKREGLRNVTSDQLWAQNALVLATKGHAFRGN